MSWNKPDELLPTIQTVINIVNNRPVSFLDQTLKLGCNLKYLNVRIDVGVFGDIKTKTTEGQFKSRGYGSIENKVTFLDAEKELFRNLLESYLESEQFLKDVSKLDSVVSFEINRGVNLVMPNEG